MDAPLSAEKPDGSADEGEQQAFGQQLGDQAGPARAQSRTHGKFLAPADGTGHDEVGDVGARDQKDESDGSEQNKQDGPNLAHDLFCETFHDKERGSVFLWICAGELRVDAVHFRAGLIGRDARGEPAEDAEPAETAARDGISALVHGNPQRRGSGGCKLKVARKNADDGGGLAVQVNDAPDDLRIGAKLGAPKGIGENRHGRAIFPHFALEEITSKSGLNTESRKKTRRNLRGESVLGLAIRRKSEGITAVTREGLDTLCRALPIQIVRVRSLSAIRAVVGLTARLAKMEELAGIAIRQRMKEGRINDRENGGF